MSDITQWAPVDANNGDVPPDGFPEGMPASAVNDASRAVMGGVRRYAEDGAWFNWGHSATYVSPTVFQVPGDLSAVYLVGRRVRVVQTATVYGVIASVAVSANTDVTVTLDAGTLANEAMAVSVGPEPNALGIAGLGTAAYLDVGTDIGDLVQLEDVGGSAGLPAVDGSQLLNVDPGPVVLLSTVALSGQSSVEFTDSAWFTAPYRHLEIHVDGLTVSTGASLWFRISTDGGSTYLGDTPNTEYLNMDQGVNGSGVAESGTTSLSQWGPAGDLAPSANGGFNGYMIFRNLDVRPHVQANFVWQRTTTGAMANDFWGFTNSSYVVNAIKVIANVGNFPAGLLRLYGYK